jgi:hypothetical protein
MFSPQGLDVFLFPIVARLRNMNCMLLFIVIFSTKNTHFEIMLRLPYMRLRNRVQRRMRRFEFIRSFFDRDRINGMKWMRADIRARPRISGNRMGRRSPRSREGGGRDPLERMGGAPVFLQRFGGHHPVGRGGGSGDRGAARAGVSEKAVSGIMSEQKAMGAAARVCGRKAGVWGVGGGL